MATLFLVPAVLGAGNAYAVDPDPDIVVQCLNLAQDTLEAEHEACMATGRNQMLAGCSGAAGAALGVCVTVPHPFVCIGANVVGVAFCAGSFYTAWDEAQSCMEAADARFHQAEYSCQTSQGGGSGHPAPGPVQDCTDAAMAESNHISASW